MLELYLDGRDIIINWLLDRGVFRRGDVVMLSGYRVANVARSWWLLPVVQWAR